MPSSPGDQQKQACRIHFFKRACWLERSAEGKLPNGQGKLSCGTLMQRPKQGTTWHDWI